MSNQVTFDENVACNRCGRFGAYVFDGEKLCAECYELRGSCCPEFGSDDFWDGQESAKEQPAKPTCASDTRQRK